MKRPVLLATALFLSSLASAQTVIPASVERSIAMHGIQTVSAVGPEVLRVVLKAPEVSLTRFKSVVSLSMCAPHWRKMPDAKGFNPQRVEVVNASQTQGYALANPFQATCDILGMPAPGAYLDRHTWVCTEGTPCRARKQGERLASDQ